MAKFLEALYINLLKIIGSRRAIMMIWENFLAAYLIFHLSDGWQRVVVYSISAVVALIYCQLITVEPVKASVNVGVNR